MELSIFQRMRDLYIMKTFSPEGDIRFMGNNLMSNESIILDGQSYFDFVSCSEKNQYIVIKKK